MSIQGWFPLGRTGLISLQCKGLSRVFSNTTVQKHQFFGVQPSLWSSSHICTWLLKKNKALTIQIFVSKVMSLLFNMLSRFVIACLHAQLCQILCGPMNCSQLGSSVHGIFQARLLEWVAISYSRKFSWPRVLDVRRVYAPRFFVSSQQRFGVTDIKAPLAGHSSRVLDRPCYIALK